MKSILLLLLVLAAVGCKPVPSPNAAPLAARTTKLEHALHDGESLLLANGVEHWVRIAAAARATIPVVVIHGGPGGNNYAFEHTIGPELERYATVLYYEQRGCGRSKAPSDHDYAMSTLVADLEALRERLGLERIHLLGYSFGGALALEYAIAHPDRVDHMILQAPMFGHLERTRALQIDAFDVVSKGEMHERVRGILRAPGGDEEHIEQIWKVVDTKTVDALLFHDPAKAAPMRKLWAESHLGGPNQEMAQTYSKPQPGDPLLWRARGLDTRALVMVGLYDRNVGVDGPRELSQALSRADFVVFDASAHFPDLEEPDKYADTVKAFLGKR